MLICDSESDSFKWESTKIWVIAAYDTELNEWSFSFDESVMESVGVRILCRWVDSGVGYSTIYTHEELLDRMGHNAVCFHNYFQHDKPLIKKLFPWFQPKEEHDSYILSQLLNPDRGLHGLDAWGQRLGHEKPKHEEWDKFSPEMLHRCIEDVKINVQVWEALQKEKEEWEALGESWDEAIKIEYAIADLQGRQEMQGVLLDEPKATLLWEEINMEITAIDETLLKQMPLRVIRHPEVGYEKAPFTEGGELRANVVKWFEEANNGH